MLEVWSAVSAVALGDRTAKELQNVPILWTFWIREFAITCLIVLGDLGGLLISMWLQNKREGQRHVVAAMEAIFPY